MILLVCGSRDGFSAEFVVTALSHLFNPGSISLLVHGGARGVDKHADRWAKANNISVKEMLPDYDKYPVNVAPIKRNEAMARILIQQRRENGRRVYGIAFWADRSRGTGNMIDLLAYHQIPHHVINTFPSHEPEEPGHE